MSDILMTTCYGTGIIGLIGVCVMWLVNWIRADTKQRQKLLSDAAADFILAHPLKQGQHGYRMQYNGEVPKEDPHWILYPAWLESYRSQLRLEWSTSIVYANVVPPAPAPSST